MKTYKKAVSPIIAVIILIAIVVGLGAILIGVARNYMTTQEKNIEAKQSVYVCASDIALDAIADTDGKLACGDSATTIKANIQNTGTVDLDGTRSTTFYTDGTFTQGPATTAILDGKPGDILEATSANDALLSIDKVVITPMFIPAGETDPQPCAAAEVEIAGGDIAASCT